MGATPDRLLGPEIELAALLFECQVIHHLRVYAEPHGASVRFNRDNKGLEVVAVVEARDGRWIAVEVKLGHHGADEGAKHLLALRAKVADGVTPRCGALVVVPADTPLRLTGWGCRNLGGRTRSLSAKGRPSALFPAAAPATRYGGSSW